MLLLAPLRAPLRAPLGHRSVRACAPPADLPLDAIIIEEEDKDVWLEEQLEFNGLRADPRTPRALQMPIGSFELPNGRYGHAFQGGGVSLSSYDWEEAVDSGGRPGDSSRLALALDLLDSVNFLHCRGSPHLALDSQVVRVVPPSPAGPGASGLARQRSRLQLVGLGAAVRLQSRVGRRAYQLPDNAVGFHAPELLGGVVIESNLRALLAADSWSVGVLLAMILGGWSPSHPNPGPSPNLNPEPEAEAEPRARSPSPEQVVLTLRGGGGLGQGHVLGRGRNPPPAGRPSRLGCYCC